MANKPKIFESGRDMALTLIVVVVLMVGSVATTGLCTFNPGAPENGPVQEVDAASFLSLEARSVDFEVRLPEVPEGWTANSARRAQINGAITPIVGFITADEGYLQLTQSGQSVEDAVRVDAEYREPVRTEDVSGLAVTVYEGESNDVRDLWVADLGGERIVVSGAATDEDFRTLIDATAQADPLPRTSVD